MLAAAAAADPSEAVGMDRSFTDLDVADIETLEFSSAGPFAFDTLFV